MISLSEFLIVAAMLFGLGIAGLIINRKNIISLLMSIELLWRHIRSDTTRDVVIP